MLGECLASRTKKADDDKLRNQDSATGPHPPPKLSRGCMSSLEPICWRTKQPGRRLFKLAEPLTVTTSEREPLALVTGYRLKHMWIKVRPGLTGFQGAHQGDAAGLARTLPGHALLSNVCYNKTVRASQSAATFQTNCKHAPCGSGVRYCKVHGKTTRGGV